MHIEVLVIQKSWYKKFVKKNLCTLIPEYSQTHPTFPWS